MGGLEGERGNDVVIIISKIKELKKSNKKQSIIVFQPVSPLHYSLNSIY